MPCRRPTRPRRFAFFPALLALAAAACAPVDVRTVATLDPNVPVGHIDGNRFIGRRIPMTITTGETRWQIATTYPPFLLETGYEKEGLEHTQVFLFDPRSHSSLQISFSPAGARNTFSQEGIERLTGIVAGGMAEELDQEFGPGNYRIRYGSAHPYPLEGLTYAARDEVSYTSGPVQRTNGWIYAFAEPFQVFFLYQLEGSDPAVRRDLDAILSTFRYRNPQ